MNTSITSFMLLIIFALSITSIACANQDQNTNNAAANYSRLCKIFDETMKKQISIEMQSYEISNRISTETPSLFDLRKHIANADPVDAYNLYKQSAKFASVKNRECPAIRTFYGPKKIIQFVNLQLNMNGPNTTLNILEFPAIHSFLEIIP